MIQKVEMFTVICDNCGEDAGCDCDDGSCWNDEAVAEEKALESEWINSKGLHYCPKCYSYDDDDVLNLVISPYSKSAK